MSRNAQIAERLTKGETVEWRPKGNSMRPLIKSGQLVTVEPCKLEDTKSGDVVFCKVNGRFFLHLVRIKAADGRVMISNNNGHDNGWTRTVYGKLVRVQP